MHLSLDVLLGDVDQTPVHERVTPKEHAEFHGVSVGQGEVHLPSVVTELHGGLDHQALFRDARRVFDLLPPRHTFLATHHNAAVVLNGGHVEFDPLLSVLDERLDVVRLDGGGLRSRIDAGFDGGHSQLRETAPLYTSNHMHDQRLKKGAQKYGGTCGRSVPYPCYRCVKFSCLFLLIRCAIRRAVLRPNGGPPNGQPPTPDAPLARQLLPASTPHPRP